jgi:hypothetical protein
MIVVVKITALLVAARQVRNETPDRLEHNLLRNDRGRRAQPAVRRP